MSWHNRWNDTAWLNTPQEYLNQIWTYLINATDSIWQRLNDYPIIKSMARITLIAFFLFRLLNKNK